MTADNAFEVVELEPDPDTEMLRDCARSAWVDITDVVAAAVKVQASELKVGDSLFDAFGGTHEIVDIRRRKNSQWIDTHRHDGYVDRWARTDTVTVLRGTE